MITKINKKFENFYNVKKKNITCYLDDNDFCNLFESYLNLDISDNDNENEVLDKFKTICYFNFFSNYSMFSERLFCENYNYLVDCIYKDIVKYIHSDVIKFNEIFYHPLNNCIICDGNNFKHSMIDTDIWFSSDKVDHAYFNIIHNDIKNDLSLTNCANIMFKYNYKEKENVLCVCFFLCNSNYCRKIIPRIKKLKIETYEKYKNKLNDFLQKHTELNEFIQEPTTILLEVKNENR